MAWPTINLRRRLILASVLAAIIALVIVVSQLVWMPSPGPDVRPADSEGDAGELTPEARHTVYRLALSLVTLLLLTLFLVAVYILTRMGRALKQTAVGGEPTKYVDAWSQYRLSEDEIDEATDEGDGDFETPREEPPSPGSN